ncbi:MAG: PAS domain-containing sensor histidine kinase [Sphingobacteriaceae bacterium]|nr:MAG: PAS domain-containing sensor histidine kinase [Sphingobacteriaceae bacterium]
MQESKLLDLDNQQLKCFYALSSQPMLITDQDALQILGMNESARKLTGYDNEDVFPQLVENILQTRNTRLAKLDATLTIQKNLKKEFTLINQNGKSGFVEVDQKPILYQGKEALLFSMTDITDKKLYRAMLEDAIEEEINLKTQNQELKKIAYLNLHLARKPLANILGLVNVLNQSASDRKTLAEALEFLRESGNQLDELIKNIDPQEY